MCGWVGEPLLMRRWLSSLSSVWKSVYEVASALSNQAVCLGNSHIQNVEIVVDSPRILVGNDNYGRGMFPHHISPPSLVLCFPNKTVGGVHQSSLKSAWGNSSQRTVTSAWI